MFPEVDQKEDLVMEFLVAMLMECSQVPLTSLSSKMEF